MFSFISLVLIAASPVSPFIEGERQLTFEGRRAGEGYFSADGRKLIFQSERERENPFYQMYLLDLETGETERVSTGRGKTTCGWIHPKGGQVLFSSTHADPEALEKQAAELEERASGRERRYSWDYDPAYEIVTTDLDTGEIRNLTNTRGYDAEGAYSPDGQQIVFASNRAAYAGELSEEEQKKLGIDQSYFVDLYLMNADGSGVRRLTDTPGYDGGPFFSADGTRICWRRFSEDGATAEIFVMNADGSEQRQMTALGSMSWAPFFHPSGDYLIFTTNQHGFDNFELYMVRADGSGEPVRVTEAGGFDGLPAFSPDGAQIAWTSTRTQDRKAQLFLGRWDDARAREALGLSAYDAMAAAGTAELPHSNLQSEPAITTADLRAHVENLASAKMEGRLTGTAGCAAAEDYMANYFERLGLLPAGEAGSWFQTYTFTAGISLGDGNALHVVRDGVAMEAPVLDADWRPLAFSSTGEFSEGSVVFAGYGFRAPAEQDAEEYDSFVHLDVTDKWVLVLRYLPENVSPERRQQLGRYSGLRYKAMLARDLGARGLLIATGPNAHAKDDLVKLGFDVALASTSIAALSISDDLAQRLLDGAEKDLKTLQDSLDTGAPQMGFEIPGMAVSAQVNLVKEERRARNVLARLPAQDQDAALPAIHVGAHLDHLGRGEAGKVLGAHGQEEGTEVYFGADDNASGSAALLEIAEWLTAQRGEGWQPVRDVVFAAWTGEELGLLGSDHFVKQLEAAGGTKNDISHAAGAYLNMDMVGRLQERLVLHGMGSSGWWRGAIERANVPVGLALDPQNESYLPTDATSFYVKRVPILSAFTGVHEDYHKPSDTPEKLTYDGLRDIARLMGNVAKHAASESSPIEYIAMEKPADEAGRGAMRAYLGTVPDYADTDVAGVKLSGVTKGAPAEVAGLKGGDIITELAGAKIENIYDYTYAIQSLKVGEEVTVVISRDGEAMTLKVTPGSRE